MGDTKKAAAIAAYRRLLRKVLGDTSSIGAHDGMRHVVQKTLDDLRQEIDADADVLEKAEQAATTSLALDPHRAFRILLQLCCGKCRQRVEVSFSENRRTPGESVAAAQWICPRCETVHILSAIGRVWSVTALAV